MLVNLTILVAVVTVIKLTKVIWVSTEFRKLLVNLESEQLYIHLLSSLEKPYLENNLLVVW